MTKKQYIEIRKTDWCSIAVGIVLFIFAAAFLVVGALLSSIPAGSVLLGALGTFLGFLGALLMHEGINAETERAYVKEDK